MDKNILQQNDKRFMRYEPNPYRGDRYAVYEHRGSLPDRLLYTTHNKNAAQIFWDRVKDLPVEDRRTSFIEW